MNSFIKNIEFSLMAQEYSCVWKEDVDEKEMESFSRVIAVTYVKINDVST